MLEISAKGGEIAALFRGFGLNEYEARVYVALQLSGKARVGRIWRPAGIPQSRVYSTVQTLEVKGLVETVGTHPLEVRAKPFLRFANDYLYGKRCALAEIQEKIGQYTELKKSRMVEVLI